MTVAEVMVTDLITVGSDVGLKEAVDHMNSAHIRHLPVVRGDRLVGIVSDRDIRLFGMTMVGDTDGDLRFSIGVDVTVREVMQQDPVLIEPDVDVCDALDMMIDDRVGAIPVVDEDDRLLGIVSYVDMLKLLQDRL